MTREGSSYFFGDDDTSKGEDFPEVDDMLLERVIVEKLTGADALSPEMTGLG